jgi:hypothetical protein
MLFAVSAQRRAWPAGLASVALAAAIGYSHVIWWVPVNHPSHSELHLDPLQLVYADGYVLLALAALAAVAWRAGSPARWLARMPLTRWARPRQTLKETA